MKSVCFSFQVHQPFRLKRYRFFQIGKDYFYFDDFQNKYFLNRISDKCYLPMNALLLEVIKESNYRVKVSFSLSGTAIEQFEIYRPDVLISFRKLAETGCVEFLSETYYHSLSSLYNKNEFFEQVALHKEKIQKILGVEPKTFRNTEMIYSDDIGDMVYEMGYETILTEGAKHILGWRSPNMLYCSASEPNLKLLLRNFVLSDDIAFRFSNKNWNEYPLTSEKFASWILATSKNDYLFNIFIDYETFGEHQPKESGIFDFMRAFLLNDKFRFITPSEASKEFKPVAPIAVNHTISWADEERDITAWLGNDLQRDAYEKLYTLEPLIISRNNDDLKRIWRHLQTSDHLYYMSTKWFSDGAVHQYFNPYESPYDAYINYMNVISDFKIRLNTENFTNFVSETNKSNISEEKKYQSEKELESKKDIKEEKKEKKAVKTIKKTTKMKAQTKSKTKETKENLNEQKEVKKAKATQKKTTSEKKSTKKNENIEQLAATETENSKRKYKKTKNIVKRFTDILKVADFLVKRKVSKLDNKIIFAAIANQKDEMKDKILSNITREKLNEYEKLSTNNELNFSEKEIKEAQKIIMNLFKE